MDKELPPDKATFAAGCFWGVEAAFRRIDGVLATAVGYTGGTTSEPTYEQVCSGRTGHAEAVDVIFDPAIVSYEKLVEVFFSIHDPTRADCQGPDGGSNYRSAIFYHTPEQKKIAEEFLQRLRKSGAYRGRGIATEIVPAGTFWKAEEYHQQFYEKSGRGYCALPKNWD